MIDAPEVVEAYEADRAGPARPPRAARPRRRARSANSDGKVRFTAPSLIFRQGGRSLEAGGFQPVRRLRRLHREHRPDARRAAIPAQPGDDIAELIASEPWGPRRREVAQVMAGRNDAPDDVAAEDALIDALSDSGVRRDDLGNGALWHPAERRRRGALAGRSAATAGAR